jgi:hypothetical protein
MQSPFGRPLFERLGLGAGTPAPSRALPLPEGFARAAAQSANRTPIFAPTPSYLIPQRVADEPPPGPLRPELMQMFYRRPQTVSPLDFTPEQTEAFQNAVNSNGSFGDGFGPDRLMRPSGDIQAVSFGMPQPSPISEMVNAANPNGLPFSGPGGGQPAYFPISEMVDTNFPLPPPLTGAPRPPGGAFSLDALAGISPIGPGAHLLGPGGGQPMPPSFGGIATSLGSTGNSVQPGIGMFPLIGPPLTGTSRPPNIGPLPNPDEGFVPPHKRTPRPPFLTNSVVLPESGFSTVGPGSAPANVQPISSGGGLSNMAFPTLAPSRPNTFTGGLFGGNNPMNNNPMNGGGMNSNQPLSQQIPQVVQQAVTPLLQNTATQLNQGIGSMVNQSLVGGGGQTGSGGGGLPAFGGTPAPSNMSNFFFGNGSGGFNPFR